MAAVSLFVNNETAMLSNVYFTESITLSVWEGGAIVLMMMGMKRR